MAHHNTAYFALPDIMEAGILVRHHHLLLGHLQGGTRGAVYSLHAEAQTTKFKNSRSNNLIPTNSYTFYHNYKWIIIESTNIHYEDNNWLGVEHNEKVKNKRKIKNKELRKHGQEDADRRAGGPEEAERGFKDRWQVCMEFSFPQHLQSTWLLEALQAKLYYYLYRSKCAAVNQIII